MHLLSLMHTSKSNSHMRRANPLFLAVNISWCQVWLWIQQNNTKDGHFCQPYYSRAECTLRAKQGLKWVPRNMAGKEEANLAIVAGCHHLSLTSAVGQTWGPVSNVPVSVERFIQHKIFIALPGKVASKAQKGGDVNPVHMLRVLHVTAQVELGQQDLGRFFL